MTIIIGSFIDAKFARNALEELEKIGFKDKISITQKNKITNETNLQAQALNIKGAGNILAMGPICDVFSESFGGGIAGSLVDYGIPCERGYYYENKLKEGNIIITVQANIEKANEIQRILQSSGGVNVDIH